MDQKLSKTPTQTQYDPRIVERKWQRVWEKQGLNSTPKGGRNKKYVLDMFPYPSGATLHVGHVEGYVGTDIVARYERMRGNRVLHPMGWDSFGLPAENYAIKTSIHPDQSTHNNIKTFKRQLASTGLSYDWSREIDTSSPEFYKWTQWLFILMYKRGLAYKKLADVNWCSSCETVLANEQVVEGKCERCGTEVVNKKLNQWFLKITDYADRLISGLDSIDWLEEVKVQQKNWIGRSEGAEIEFRVKGKGESVKAFTTRPDTLYGATFMVLAHDSEWVAKLTTEEQKEAVSEYLKIQQKNQKSEEQKGKEIAKEKTGVFTGSYVINPATKEQIPVYLSNYVLSGYGSGAIMGVPAHDSRDFEFAKKYNLPIKPVILPQREYIDENADDYYKKRTENNKNIIKDLASRANKNNKKLLMMGGWATGIQAGEIFREHADIDMIILEEDLDWWREQLRDLGLELSNMFPEGQNDKYYFQATKPDVHIDVLTFKVEEGEVVSLTGKKPKKLGHSFDEMFELGKIDDEPVYAVRPEFIYEWKKDHQERTGDIRWKEQADFLMLGFESYMGPGKIVNSGKWNGISVPEGLDTVLSSLVEEGWGERKVTYHLRDWLISRQRYWGTPVPMIFCEKCKLKSEGEKENMPGWYTVPEEDLPVLLPKDVDFRPRGESPLARSEEFQADVVCPGCGAKAIREVDTMDTYVDSSWYFIRFVDPHNSEEFASQEATKEWLPVDIYVGGGHVVQHLLFARFFWKVLFDAELLDKSLGDEPFLKLRAPGWILGSDSRKMSKRWNNVVTPDDIIPKYGADTLRMYEMFMGPFEAMKLWSLTGVEGMWRFINRVWRLVTESKDVVLTGPEDSEQILRAQHKTIQKVTKDIEELHFNTAIASLMEFVNLLQDKASDEVEKAKSSDSLQRTKVRCAEWDEAIRTLLLLLAPFAPHVTEELWQLSVLGSRLSVESPVHQLTGKLRTDEPRAEDRKLKTDNWSVHLQLWPKYNPDLIREEEVVYAVQVNGKLRGIISVPQDMAHNQSLVEQEAKANEQVHKYLEAREIKKAVFVPNKLVNFVV